MTPRRSPGKQIQRLLLLVLGSLFLTAASTQSQPNKSLDFAIIEPWLGQFQFGPETVELVWDGGLIIHLDKIPIPADGQWHDTVPTFSVRHRASWLGVEGGILVEEQHNRGSLWQYRFVLSEDRGEITKLVKTGSDYHPVRVYRRIAP